MNPIKRLYQSLRGTPQNNHSDPAYGMHSLGNRRSLFDVMHSDAYSSSYPSIRAISNEYMTVRPFAVNAKGERQQNNDIINALYHPNQADSSVSFFEKMAVTTLALRKTYVLVWHRDGNEAKPGGDFKSGQRIAGFTYLEFPSVERLDGKTYYNVGLQKFSEDEVLVLPGGVDPYNLYAGYSPSEAARRWAKLDDYIADFQAGFFENGAVPAGEFLITARTTKEYNDIVNMLEDRHRGAGKNGNVTYTHRPIDPESGKPADAQIEWVPFGQLNKDIDFKNLFSQVNNRIDVAFGVPAIVKGIDDAATYANAQVAEKTFAKRAVYPLLLRNWTQFTHELNRITNGTGIAITFEYDIPTVADEELVNAQRKQVEVTTITSLTTLGFSLDSIVDALNLDVDYKKLALGDISTTDDETDDTDVDDGGEVDSSPDPDEIDGVTPTNKLPAISNKLTDREKLEKVAKEYMKSQVDRAIDELEEGASNSVDPTDDELDTFVDDAFVVIVGIMVDKGEVSYQEGVALILEAGLETENLDKFIMSDAAKDSYQAYLRKVGNSYGSDTADSIRKVLTEASDEGLSVADTKKALRNIMDTDEYRVLRLAKTEVARSSSLSGVEAMKQIQAEAGVEMEKSLFHKNGPQCEFCKALEGQWQVVDAPLVGLGETLTGIDGGVLINDFVTNDGYDPHPNGKGSMIFRLKGETATTEDHLQVKIDEQKQLIDELRQQLKDSDGRTKESKGYKLKIEDMEKYITQLEGIVDGQV